MRLSQLAVTRTVWMTRTLSSLPKNPLRNTFPRNRHALACHKILRCILAICLLSSSRLLPTRTTSLNSAVDILCHRRPVCHSNILTKHKTERIDRVIPLDTRHIMRDVPPCIRGLSLSKMQVHTCRCLVLFIKVLIMCV